MNIIEHLRALVNACEDASTEGRFADGMGSELTALEEAKAALVEFDFANPVIMVCDVCGGHDVVADAAARWNIVTQQWEVSAVYDKGHSCGDCDSEVSIEEVPV